MNGIIIFCQAFADLQYALSIYERTDTSYRFIIVINNENLFNFLKTLKTGRIELVYIDLLLEEIFKKPKSIIHIKKKLAIFYNTNFTKIVNYNIYYFSNGYDWITFYFIKKLSARNQCYLYNHYGTLENELKYVSDLKSQIKKLILYYITGIHYKIIKNKSQNVILFPSDEYNVKNIIIEVNYDIFRQYSYKAKYMVSNLSILFLDNFSVGITNYNKSLKKVFAMFEANGYEIWIKPHPRLLNHVSVYENYNLLVEKIPVEFLDISKFRIIIGIDSLSLANLSNIYPSKLSISIINLMDFNNDTHKKMGVDYLMEHSNGSLLIIKSFIELKNMLK